HRHPPSVPPGFPRRPAVGRSTPRRPAGPAAHRGGATDAKPGTRGSGPAVLDPAPTRDLERGPEPRRVVGFARAVGRSVAPGPPGRFDAPGRPPPSAPAGPPPPCTELQEADIAFVAHGRGWQGGPEQRSAQAGKPVSEQRSGPTKTSVVQARQPAVRTSTRSALAGSSRQRESPALAAGPFARSSAGRGAVRVRRRE